MKGIAAYTEALKARGADILWAEVNAQARESLHVEVQEGRIARTAANAQTAFYVRASAGRAGYAYTQDPQDDAAAMLRRAAENGMACERERPNVLGERRVEAAGALEPEPDIDALAAVGHALTRAAEMADSRVAHASAEVSADTQTVQVVGSQGLDVGAARRVYVAKVSILMEKDGKQANANAHVTAQKLSELNLSAAAARAVWQADMQLDQGELKAGVYPVVLDSSVVINIFTTAWQLFSATKYQDGSSALSGLLGQAVASPALSITDSPTRPGCGYAFALDGEGCPGAEAALIRGGVLTGLMHTRATAAQFGTEPSGNGGRVATLTGSVPTDLIVVPKVFCVEPGARDQKALLAAMGDGVFITRSFDVFHSVNVGSGDFAIPCSGAVIESGKVTRRVGGLTICGNLRALLANVEEAGSDLWIDEFLLKSYCIGAPSLRVKGLQVNGGGA